MWTFDQHIVKLYTQGLISEQTAKGYATRKAIVARGIDSVKASKGEKTTDIEDLSMDEDYAKEAAGSVKLKKRKRA